VVSGLLTLSCLLIAGLPSLVIAIMALVRSESDPASSRRLTRIGWITLGVVGGVVLVLGVVALVAVFVFGLESPDMVSSPDPSSI
jgi:hypothetical protein